MTNPQYIIDELHDLLEDAGISRTDTEIDGALDDAASDYGDRVLGRPHGASAESLHAHNMHWHNLLHEPHGVLDLLEVDSEDVLVDRLGVAA